jgi:hypothetical protein
MSLEECEQESDLQTEIVEYGRLPADDRQLIPDHRGRQFQLVRRDPMSS